MSNVLTVKDLKVYLDVDAGLVKAVDGVSFRIPAGRTMALVGESGSGKSIVAQSIMGILPRVARIEQGSIELRDPRSLRPYAGNARTHSPKQVRQIAECIRRFGFVNPILIDAEGQVIAGHGRLEAAKQLGMIEVPVLPITHLSAAEKRAYILADNWLAEKAGWDKEILAIELRALVDFDFEVELTGF